jgi:hypothetical protein
MNASEFPRPDPDNPWSKLDEEEPPRSEARDASPAPFIPPETLAAFADKNAALLFIEGHEEAANALLAAGAFPIGLESWEAAAGNNGDNPDNVRLRPEFAEIVFAKRKVYLCNSTLHNGASNRQAQIRLAFLLYDRGADVYEALWTGGSFSETLKGAVLLLETLDHADIGLAREELHGTQRDPAMFESLARKLAKQIGVTKASLGSFKNSAQSESLNGSSVRIPPTAPPWQSEVVPSKVLDEICVTLARFAWMKPSQYRAVALWIVLSYLNDVVEILPLLIITSPDQECGKTTLLKLVFYLCNRPIPASNVSAASIFRVIQNECPCLLLDEADTYMRQDEVMRGVINSGHERAMAFVYRVVDDKGNVAAFSTWCPKAIAMIGTPHGTILSRSIHIRLERKDKKTKLEKLRRKHYAEFENLRRKIVRLANDIRERVRNFKPMTNWATVPVTIGSRFLRL